MHVLFQSFLCLLLVHFSSSTPLQSLFPSPYPYLSTSRQHSSNTSTISTSVNITQSDPGVLYPFPISCNGDDWGYDLQQLSCRNALRKIAMDPAPLTVGMRREGARDWDINLPYRFLSGKLSKSHNRMNEPTSLKVIRSMITLYELDDGACAIDILAANIQEPDISTMKEVRLAAELVFRHCLLEASPANQGGIIEDLGLEQTLAVSISRYEFEAQCFSTPHRQTVPPYESCTTILSTMSVSDDPTTFGGLQSDIALPYMLVSVDGKCKLDLQIHGQGTRDDTSDWLEIWAAAVALNEVCVKKGKIGVDSGLGENRRLELRFIAP